MSHDIRFPAKAKIDIPLDGATIQKGTEIDVTRGGEYAFALWHHIGIYDLPQEYIEFIEPGGQE